MCFGLSAKSRAQAQAQSPRTAHAQTYPSARPVSLERLERWNWQNSGGGAGEAPMRNSMEKEVDSKTVKVVTSEIDGSGEERKKR